MMARGNSSEQCSQASGLKIGEAANGVGEVVRLLHEGAVAAVAEHLQPRRQVFGAGQGHQLFLRAGGRQAGRVQAGQYAAEVAHGLVEENGAAAAPLGAAQLSQAAAGLGFGGREVPAVLGVAAVAVAQGVFAIFAA